MALSSPAAVRAHSPHQREIARLPLGDGRDLSVRSHWGDGIFGPDPVMAVFVIDDGSRYGQPIAIGPVARGGGSILADCRSLDRCEVHYIGRSWHPHASFRLRPAALRRVLEARPEDWPWCVDFPRACPRRRGDGLSPIPSPVIALAAITDRRLLLIAAVKLGPLLISIVLLGLMPPRDHTGHGVLDLLPAVLGGLGATLGILWAMFGLMVGPPSPLETDLAFLMSAGVIAVVLRRLRASRNPKWSPSARHGSIP